MTDHGLVKDMIVLVPDGDMEFTLRALLLRHQVLGIRPISFDIHRHVQRDAGCRSDCHNFLRLWLRNYQYALVLFDHEGCGQERMPHDQLESLVEKRLHDNGWRNRCAVITIVPELEAWIWSDSPFVDAVLGWQNQDRAMKAWLQLKTDFWPSGFYKPERPKEALESVLRKVRKQRSPRLFEDLAKQVAFDRCIDASFCKLKQTLMNWFRKEPC
jgi:hypothetical protein